MLRSTIIFKILAPRKSLMVSVTLLSLFFASITPLVFAFDPAPYWKDYGIKLKNLAPEQLTIIESTFEKLRGLKSGALKISPSTYKKLSRFKKLFGFEFNGPKMSDWILQRIRKIEQKETWTALVNHRKGTFQIGKIFFEELTPLERMYALVHEARHSDGAGYPHVRCPKGFPFISSRQPNMDLAKNLACDNNDKGAYAFQAAFLFELFAYGLLETHEVGLLYNSSISRIIP